MCWLVCARWAEEVRQEENKGSSKQEKENCGYRETTDNEGRRRGRSEGQMSFEHEFQMETARPRFTWKEKDAFAP